MPNLTLATIAVPNPMGQQCYEEAIAARAAGALGAGWQVERTIVRSLRSPVPGNVRVPARLLGRSGAATRRATGRLLYRGASLVHRMDLRLPPARQPEVITVHDVVQWRFPDETDPPRASLREIGGAVAVVCPSRFAAEEVHRFLGGPYPVVIPNGVDPDLFDARAATEQDLAALGIRRPFVLHAGGATLRKNLAGLAAAWPVVRRAHPDVMLVLAGARDDRRDRLFAGMSSVVRVGRVDRRVLVGLMAAAGAVVVPSLYEGFGLPALEAMAVGVPVVAAARSSLPEVCEGRATLVEPSGSGLADGLVAVLEGAPETREMVAAAQCRAREFTWDASAAAHAELWRSLAGG